MADEYQQDQDTPPFAHPEGEKFSRGARVGLSRKKFDHDEWTSTGPEHEKDRFERPNGGGIRGIIHKWFISPFLKKAEKFSQESIRDYATDEHGRVDERLAVEIRHRVIVRARIAAEQYIHEPITWAPMVIWGTGAAVTAIRWLVDRVTKTDNDKFRDTTKGVAIITFASAVAMQALELARIPRKLYYSLVGARNSAIETVERERYEEKMAQEPAKPSSSEQRAAQQEAVEQDQSLHDRYGSRFNRYDVGQTPEHHAVAHAGHDGTQKKYTSQNNVTFGERHAPRKTENGVRSV